jgi:zinc/manganese transport system substrate-binding protein
MILIYFMEGRFVLKKIFWCCLMTLLLGLTIIQAQEPVKVVATYSILGEFVETVGGNLIDLTVLVGTDGDAHEYEPTPQDSVAIADAALVFENGLEFETWLDDLFAASGSSAKRVVVTEGIVPRAMEHDYEGEEHAHGEFDPHVWHNPQLVMTMIDNIATALITADPANEATYTANATSYKAELEQLDKDLQTEADKLSAEQRKLVTSHDALGYLAYRYGFEVIGAVIPSVTTESSDANAGELAELVDIIKSAGVPAIFVENITNADLVEQAANSAGVSVAPALYTDALGEEGTEGATYLGMMRYNMTTIVAALSQ